MWGYVVDKKTRLLHRRAAVFKFTAHFISRLFQRAIQTECFGLCEALAVIGAIPFGWRIQDLLRALRNFEIGFGDERPDFGGIAWVGLADARLRLHLSGTHQHRHASQDSRRRWV